MSDGEARPDGVAQDHSQLEKTLPVMLQGGHLTAWERLAFFRTSKLMAQAVLRHAACTHLTLTLGGPPPPALGIMLGISNSSGDSSSSSARAHAAVAQQLAADSPNVTLMLRYGMLTPSACLKSRITTIQLHETPVGPSTRSLLQLHELPRLHTLSLQQCRMERNQPQASPQHVSSSVRTLECINNRFSPIPLAFSRVSDPFYSAYSFLLIDPAQLQTLITDDPPAFVSPLLPQLPALQELRLLSSAGGNDAEFIKRGLYQGSAAVTDADIQRLLNHPQLTRVELPQTQLCNSHADTPCAWDSLLLHDARLVDLARMPLGGVKSCTVRGRLIAHIFKQETSAAPAGPAAAAPAAAPAAAAAAATIGPMVNRTMPNLVLEAAPNYGGCRWYFAEPTFTLVLRDGYHNEGDQGKVIAFCMRHLEPGVALVIDFLNATRSPDFLASLAAAPATLTTICFTNIYSVVAGQGAGVLTHLSAHVSRVIVEMQSRNISGLDELDLLDYFVTGVQRPLRFTLITPNTGPHRGGPWSAARRERVHAWMAIHGSQHVQVDFDLVNLG